jgi:hypothetical protein
MGESPRCPMCLGDFSIILIAEKVFAIDLRGDVNADFARRWSIKGEVCAPSAA